MTDVTTVSGTPMPATVEQLAVPRAMIAATEPYRVANRLVSAFGGVAEVLLNQDDGFLRVDRKGQLLCLQNTMTEAQRWRLGYRANDELRDLPALAGVLAAHHASAGPVAWPVCHGIVLASQPRHDEISSLDCRAVSKHRTGATNSAGAWWAQGVPKKFRNQPVLKKPFQITQLGETISSNPVSSRNAECLTSGMPIAYRSRFAGGEDVLDDRDR
jgi:hypothetical protein